jgi:uncharacterized protein (TIGR02569 family)
MSSPPPHVLAAFGVPGQMPVPLTGGMGTSWRAGDLVLKPADADQEELTWQAQLHSRLPGRGYRLARIRQADDGSVCVGGWSATEFVPGRHQPRRWPEIIAVGERFHAELRAVPRPGFLDRRSSPWAVSERVAWGEAPAGTISETTYLPRLTAAVRPVSAASQVIHGDLTGNVLFHEQLPPAIIDLTAYWRPAAFASAVVVADALVWEGADDRILRAVSHVDDFGQYLVRALMFRVAADWLLSGGASPEDHGAGARWASAVDLACRLATAAGPD